jgi:predicted nucleic acid-binding protein
MSRREAAVADAGPLIHLDELEQLDLLEIYSKVWVPSTVALEAEYHRPGWRDRGPANISRVEVSPEEVEALRKILATSLDPGELESMAYWHRNQELSLLCDDLEARTVARNLGASVIGTLGILVLSAKTGRADLQAVLDHIRSLPERTTLHIGRDLIDSAVLEVERALK